MTWRSLEERKKAFLEDCCGGGGGMAGGDGGGPTMTVGDAGFQSASPAQGPRAGYDNILGKALKKRQEARTRRNVKEGYKERSERDHDRMNDAALRHDKAHQKSTNTGKLSYEGDVITKEISNARMDPKGYAKEKQEKEKENRERGSK
jgi:hypothetical protein